MAPSACEANRYSTWIYGWYQDRERLFSGASHEDAVKGAKKGSSMRILEAPYIYLRPAVAVFTSFI